MFLPVGGDKDLDVRDIVGIFVMENGQAESHGEFLSKNKEQVRAVQEPRAIVVTGQGIYLSPFSAATLRRRLEDGARIYG